MCLFAGMFYDVVLFIFQITIRIFFKSINITRGNVVPPKGPLIVLANHPATLMDAIVVASFVGRKVHFMVKGELFKGPLANYIMEICHIIPVYRVQDDPGQINKNAGTFRKCYESLEKGEALLIFPEGVSITERKLKPIKPGASFIALGAEARNDFNLGIKIVCIGLNYVDQHKFNRDVFVNFNTPLEVSHYKQEYNSDKSKALKSLTQDIHHKLEEVVISVQDAKTDDLVKNIETLYTHQLKLDRSLSGKKSEIGFSITKNIVKAINYFNENEPEFVEAMQTRINNYFKKLNALKLDDDFIGSKKGSILSGRIRGSLFLLFGFPVFLFGYINNILAFWIPGWIAETFVKDRDYRGSVAMISGIFTFTLFYSIQITIFHLLVDSGLATLLYTITLPLTGFFAYYYWDVMDKVRAKWWFHSLFKNNQSVVQNLIEERKAIIREFTVARRKYILKHIIRN